jgi:transcriptional regulator with XRE-family HTH domain
MQTSFSRIRKERGFTGRALAEAVGCSRESINKWQEGYCTPHYSNILKLEAVLETPIAQLLAPDATTRSPESGTAQRLPQCQL